LWRHCRSIACDDNPHAPPVRRDVGPPGRYPYRVDRDEILRVFRAFEAVGLEYVLIGATAMGFHGVVRATEDLDLFTRATTENVARLRAALRASYADDPHIDDTTAADLLPNKQLQPTAQTSRSVTRRGPSRERYPRSTLH
jgi:hypothetical protein